MYVCMYICMYVCMYVWWLPPPRSCWAEGRIGTEGAGAVQRINVCMHLNVCFSAGNCIFVCMHVCMYVHKYEGTIPTLVWAIEINCDQCIK